MSDMRTANIIREQIGHKALYMMGAKNLVGDSRQLTWKVGRNSKRVRWVQVILDPSDTYTVRFLGGGRAPSFEVIERASHSMVYFDQLHAIIEKETGFYLSL